MLLQSFESTLLSSRGAWEHLESLGSTSEVYRSVWVLLRVASRPIYMLLMMALKQGFKQAFKQALKQARKQALKQDMKWSLSHSAQYRYSSKDCRYRSVSGRQL